MRRGSDAERCLALMLWAATAAAGGPAAPRLGIPARPEALQARAPLVFPDGRGLPAGQGDAAQGAALYATRCLRCHGPEGRGGSGGELAGGQLDLTAAQPDKTIGSYWPYATTLFAFVRRAMPLDAPGSLDDGQTYAIVAYLLALNGILPTDATLDAATLAAVRMPNRDGFVPIDARP